MLPLIMAGASLLNQREKNAQAERDRMLAAQTQMYSPWTKLTAGPIGKKESPLIAGVGGYASGLGQMQNIQAGEQALQGSQLQNEVLGQQKLKEAAEAAAAQAKAQQAETAAQNEAFNNKYQNQLDQNMKSKMGVTSAKADLSNWMNMAPTGKREARGWMQS